MTKGWRNEPYRHGMARKGIKSKGYAIKGERIIRVDYDGFTLEQAQKRLEEVKKENKEFWTPERLKAKKEMDDAIEKEKKKKIIKFKTYVVTENSFGVVDDYGIVDNEMTLKETRYPKDFGDYGNYHIDWEVIDKDGEIINAVEIGIWAKGKNIVEYDGVFELPKEAIKLLKQNGFKTKNIE